MIRFFGYIWLFAIIVSCTTSSDDFVEERISLAGMWGFRADSELKGIEEGWFDRDNAVEVFTDSLIVPGNWDIDSTYANYRGVGWYATSFGCPAEWSEKLVRLKFGAVYETSDIWLNGKYLGQHKGGYTPFEFDVSNTLLSNQSNTLIVRADNSFKRGAWWPWGGISKEVELIASNSVRIVSQHITTTPDLERGMVDFFIKYTITNTESKFFAGKLNMRLSAANEDMIYEQNNVDVILQPNSTATFNIDFRLGDNQIKLWGLDARNLYSIKSELYQSDQLRSQALDRVGVRKVEVRGTKVLLNGEALHLAGMNRIPSHRVYGSTEPDLLVKSDLDMIMATGARMARLSHMPLSPSLLDYCDEKGFLIIGEIPLWGAHDPNAFPENPLSKQWMKEMIGRDYNHPSIIGWSVGNELGGDSTLHWKHWKMSQQEYNYVASMVDYTRSQLDSTRLLTYISYTAFRDEVNDQNEPANKLDFISINCYGNAPLQVDKVHERWPNKPVFISEYGKSRIGEDLSAELSDKWIEDFEDLWKRDYVMGISVWSFNDYRSDYKGTPASQNRDWGVVNVWREKKKAYSQFQELLSK